ncbi:MAG TPA: putative Na+/H+ antiporter [Chthoniobacterales bacterium]|jgi:Na+/H+ antiporter NhaD/arsenite permease-like protein|nr:putative Na+/H+ antiporter [Chthoniobacterales bacterium]
MKTWFAFVILSCLLFSAAPAGATQPTKDQKFPLSSDGYHDDSISSLRDKLIARIRQEPFNAAGTVIFFAAIIHTFLTSRFQKIAHDYDVRARTIENLDPPERDKRDKEWDRLLFRAQFFHFMGEIEAVFGIWLVPLIIAIIFLHGWSSMVDYVGHVEETEALFVVVIMAMASSLPILRLAENAIARIADLGRGSPAIWWLSILTIGPVLGSLITEPAAMTISALLLRHRFYNLHPSVRLKYATLGLLFVNVSVGGTLTHFAAPPVVIVASHWHWDLLFMLQNFGWKAVIAILVSNLLFFLFFRKELTNLAVEPDAEESTRERREVPWSITFIHLLFLAWTVVNAHYPTLIIFGFLFFLAFVTATRRSQSQIGLRQALLVGFFLGSLVIHGGCQEWWIVPVLKELTEWPMMLGATILTAFNDNAAITYLAALVPDLSDPLKYAVMAGAITGGGLTVIANAPNPAGVSILSSRFGEGGIAPLGLFLGALVPTLVAGAAFMLL